MTADRVLPIRDGRVRVSRRPGEPRLVTLQAGETPAGQRFPLAPGWSGLRLDREPTPAADEVAGDLRQIGDLLGGPERHLVARATTLERWFCADVHCPGCGAVTERAGLSRRCGRCGRGFRPPIEPAVLVLVTDAEDRCLLQHGRLSPARHWSVVAGYIEAGEAAEAAAAREVREETGITVTKPLYVASQPWPFPASLMLGFVTTAVETALCPDSAEVAAARWFTRDDLRDEVEAGRIELPPAASLARELIERWRTAGQPSRCTQLKASPAV